MSVVNKQNLKLKLEAVFFAMEMQTLVYYTQAPPKFKNLQWDFRSEISKKRETNILVVLRF